MNSKNSAIAENEIFMESLQGKINALTSSLQSLSNNTLNSDFVGNIITATTEIIKFIDASGGLVPILSTILGKVLALKGANISTWHIGLVKDISNIAKSMMIAKVATDGITASAITLQGAMGLVGLITIALSGLYMGMQHLAKQAEKAREKVAELSESVKQLSANKEELSQLTKQFDEIQKLGKAQGLNTEQQQQFYNIQEKIVGIIPEANHYYDEQGRVILATSESVETLNAKYEEMIANEKEALAIGSKKTFDKTNKDYLAEKERMDGLLKIQEMKKKSESVGLSNDESLELNRLAANTSAGMANVEEKIVESSNKISESLKLARQDFLNVLYVTEIGRASCRERVLRLV